MYQCVTEKQSLKSKEEHRGAVNAEEAASQRDRAEGETLSLCLRVQRTSRDRDENRQKDPTETTDLLHSDSQTLKLHVQSTDVSIYQEIND